jgi:hypothetical protein
MDFTWVTPTDQTPLTTKGDLFAFSTVDARLPAGANETRLVADSAQTLGLKYVADTTNYAIAAKGDLLAGTAADTLAALSVGTNGQTLVADSTAATGLAWGGSWITFTPSRSNITPGNGTEVARYQKIGKMTNVFYQLTLGSTSSIGNTPAIATPTTSAQSVFYSGVVMMQDSGNTSYFGSVLILSGTAYPQAQVANGTYTNASNVTATIPFTWGNTDVLSMMFSYEES